MRKIVLNGKAGKDRAMNGINLIADAVSVTLGSNGRNAMLLRFFEHEYRQHWLPVHHTKDGVTVAMNIQADEAFEQGGVQLMQEASKKTMEQAGDGTTTTIVIARELCKLGLKMVYEGANPVELKRGMERAVEKVIKRLATIAIPVGDDIEKIRQVASVSSNNDPFIGNLIAEAFEKIGKEGIIDIEEAKGVETEIKISEGYKFNEGALNTLFLKKPGAKDKCILNDPYIIIYDGQIEFMKTMNPILEKVLAKTRDILIICNDMKGEAMAYMIANVSQLKLNCCVVKCPQVRGEERAQILNDIAASCNARVIGDLRGVSLEKAQLVDIGSAKRVVVTQDSTSIIGAKKRGDFQEILDNLRMDLAETKDEEEKDRLGKRLASLIGGVATIMVGGYTETEMKEKKDRVDDSVRATKAAVEEGYVPGGGVTYMSILPIEDNETKAGVDDGEQLLYRALEKPIRQICENSGVNYKELGTIDHVSGMGYNAKTGNIENMAQAGIIDPAKVIRCCIQNAASVAGLFLITECFIGDAY